MNWKKATVIFIIVVTVLIATWDVFVMSKGGLDASISQTMIMWAYKYPIFSYLMGVVTGHLFWRMRDDPETNMISQDIDQLKKLESGDKSQ